MVKAARVPRSGDRVEVKWGLGSIPGAVVEVRQLGKRFFVLVRVDVLGPSGEVLTQELVSLPSDDVRVLSA